VLGGRVLAAVALKEAPAAMVLTAREPQESAANSIVIGGLPPTPAKRLDELHPATA